MPLFRPAVFSLLRRCGSVPASPVRALTQIGWLESVKRAEPIDAEGRPLPWFTYGAISFLDQIVPTKGFVLEIGGGNSSLWWKARGNHVSVLESNADWAKQLGGQGIDDVTIVSDASAVLLHMERLDKLGARFDAVVVDGVEPRTAYLLPAAQLLSTTGVLVFDNADRAEYRDALSEWSGFNRLDFFGLGPQNRYAWGTSVFSRSAFIPKGRVEEFDTAIDY